MKLVIVNPVPPGLQSNPHLIKYVWTAASRVLGKSGTATILRVREALQGLENADALLVFGTLNWIDGWFVKLSEACRNRKVPFAFWSPDDPYEFDLNYENQHLFDWVWTTDQASVPFYDSQKVGHLPLAADPDVHFIQFPESESDFWYDVSFIGVEFPVRRSLVLHLASLLRSLKTAVIGPNWTIDESFIQRTHVSNAEAAIISNRSRLVLNMGRGDYNFFNRNGIAPSTPGPRTFEVGACGTVQLVTWHQPEIEEYYDVGEEILYSQGLAELEEQIRLLVGDPRRRKTIADSSASKTKIQHLYDHRLSTIIERLELLTKR